MGKATFKIGIASDYTICGKASEGLKPLWALQPLSKGQGTALFVVRLEQLCNSERGRDYHDLRHQKGWLLILECGAGVEETTEGMAF